MLKKKKKIWMEVKTWKFTDIWDAILQWKPRPSRTKCSLLLRASYFSTEDPDFQVRLESDCPHVQWGNLLVSSPSSWDSSVSDVGQNQQSSLSVQTSAVWVRQHKWVSSKLSLLGMLFSSCAVTLHCKVWKKPIYSEGSVSFNLYKPF